eukprot:CAMPEP_0119470948 /NCGR_PEP_ID=MMETSP1344-20130328/3629_1 /TAXON_ID=236787 /ORGANISM="Florenciella parvula, Strain CCMP2471" /LENGTH=433 /DNA_ID=CAMNT_0007503683 /DNA_START=20 /DNA_END=1321 /DNA_ORIENTATION=+
MALPLVAVQGGLVILASICPQLMLKLSRARHKNNHTIEDPVVELSPDQPFTMDADTVIAFVSEWVNDRTVQDMLVNFSTIFGAVSGLYIMLTRKPGGESLSWYSAMACTRTTKRMTETWWLAYAVFWVLCFGLIIGGGLYKWFDKHHYMIVCGGLAAPLLLQPFIAPGITGEANVPVWSRYSVKATVWIAIFSFIGNWWYTHYFYSVLKASYSMPAHDLNAVPLAMYFATHFYFTLYHALAAQALRGVRTLFVRNSARFMFECSLVCAMAYSTAFTESATISAYPCYSFADRHQAYTLGSAFYGIYFLVSYPLFATIDEPREQATPIITITTGKASPTKASPAKGGKGGKGGKGKAGTKEEASTDIDSTDLDQEESTHTLYQVVWEALGAGMAVLMLLDIVRAALPLPLLVPMARPCKSDASLTCPPFDGQLC